MRKFMVRMSTGYRGDEGVEIIDVEDDETDDEIDKMVWEMAVDHAAAYGHELCTDDCEDDDCSMEHPGMTNIEGYWEPYEAEKHDRLIPTYT